MDKVPMTPQGHAALTTELAALKAERPKVSAAIGTAAAEGDLKENAEYHAQREKQGMMEAKIRDIEDKLARAEVIDPSQLGGDKVKFGARVSLEDVDSGKKVEYRVVGPVEAQMQKGNISVESPLARALINRKEGDEVTVNVPGGERTYVISKVSWS